MFEVLGAIDAGARPGTTTDESAELKRLKKENAEPKRANDILRAAASFFAAELDGPHTLVVHRRAQGSRRRRRADLPGPHRPRLQDRPSTNYAHRKRQAAPAARTVRDTELKPLIKEAYDTNYRVYGARKIWRHLNRQGHPVARCTVERLMRELGITGAVRGKKVIATIPDPTAPRAPDLDDRDFVSDAPNRCWVADFTHVATWTGVAFVVDTFSRRIVGWSAATTKESRLVLDALEMALWQRGRDQHLYISG